jgi:plastocyanin
MHARLRALASTAVVAMSACMPCRIQAPPLAPGTGAAMEASVADAPGDTARIIEAQIVTTQGGASGEFLPREVRVRQGDVLRFRMADGDAHHNVSFSGVPAGAGPTESPYLFEKGQSWQVRIDLPPGRYELACVPHAMLDHRGTLVVEP